MTGALTPDRAGNLFGTTNFGGAGDNGTAYEVAKGSNAITTVALFNGGNGDGPLDGLSEDASDNLYGAAYSGGQADFGTVFEIPAGSSSLTTVASFSQTSGSYPESGVTLDACGNLSGATLQGGAFGQGDVYEIASGSTAITALASFQNSSGTNAESELTLDASGNLYGVTFGDNSIATIFEVAKGSGIITSLASFSRNPSAAPFAGVALDASGNIYGTTPDGGSNGDGTLYELVKGSNTLTTLVSFAGSNGSHPYSTLTLDESGNLYGTTTQGGPHSDGTVFELPMGSTAIRTLYGVTYNHVNLSQYLGNSPSAYLCFTGGTGGANAVQTISGLTYTADTTTSAPQAGPQVNLTGYFTGYGIGTAGNAVITTGNPDIGVFPNPGAGTSGFDGYGFQLDGGLLGTSATVTAGGNTQTFDFGPAAGPFTPDVVVGNGQTINLPQGHYGNISFIGFAVGSEPDNQPFTVNYTDGTSQTFFQTLSSYFFVSGNATQPGETVAVSMADELDGTGAKYAPGYPFSIDVYEYQFKTNTGKTVASITLPMNDNVKILAMNVNAAPYVTSISPTTGPIVGGNSVIIINGTGFTGATAVNFGNTPSSDFAINSTGTQIAALETAGTGTVDVTVTGPFGTSATSPADQFSYVGLPSWMAGGSAATWDASTHILTITGAATMIGDPGSDEPNIVASGTAAKLVITPAASRTVVHVNGMSLSNGASVTMTSVGAGRTHNNHNVLVIGTVGASADPTVSLDSSSRINLQDNDLIVHTGTSDSTGASELDAWRNLAATGRGVPAGGVLDGNWAGNGLTSTRAEVVDKLAGYEETVLAVVLNSDQILGADAQWTVGIASEPLGLHDIIVKYTYNGDAALQGYVGDDSVTIVNGLYDGGKSTQADWAFGDFTGVGQVNDDDITILNGLYGNGTAASGLAQL